MDICRHVALTQVIFYIFLKHVKGTSFVKATSSHTVSIDPVYDIITCGNSNHLINITNMTINHRQTQCRETGDESCQLSDWAREEIKKICNGQTECQLNISKITGSTCFQEFGHFTYSRSCHVKLLNHCNFDSRWPNSTCFIRKHDDRNLRWGRRIGNTNTEPSFDKSEHGTGHYAYIRIENTDQIQFGDEATLSFPKGIVNIDASSDIKPRCLVLWLYITEKENPLLVIDKNGRTIFNITGPRADQGWIKHRITLPADSGVEFSMKVTYSTTFHGVIAIDDTEIIDNPCEELPSKVLDCVSISEHQNLPSCSDASDVVISFDPLLEECKEVYGNISDQVLLPCSYSNGSNCSFNLEAAIDRNPYCFRKMDISIEYLCDAINSFSQINSEKEKSMSPGIIASIFVGILVLCFGCGFVWLLYTRYGAKNKGERNPQVQLSENNEYTYCQNVDKSPVITSSHSEEPTDNAQYMNTQFTYDSSAPLGPTQKNGGNKTIENGIRKDKTRLFSGSDGKRGKGQTDEHYELANQIFDNGRLDENYEVAKQLFYDGNNGDEMMPSSDGAYMVLDQTETGYDHGKRVPPTDSYEFANPVEKRPSGNQTENGDDYITSIESEYVISRSNVHNEQDTNVYSHCVDSVYDSAEHCPKDNNLDDNYDHFDATVTDDDYNISQR